MRHKTKGVPGGRGLFRRSAEAVRRIFSRSHEEPAEQAAAPAPRRQAGERPGPVRTTRRETDIPMDLLDNAYTPAMTSSKASFRSDGTDHQRDQEFAAGSADTRWNDEDRFTNKSGDPRIGTHGRSYEPAETRDETRD